MCETSEDLLIQDFGADFPQKPYFPQKVGYKTLNLASDPVYTDW